jgi:diadenosine tetraphosphate (Ap4A) HIT family hydrolase
LIIRGDCVAAKSRYSVRIFAILKVMNQIACGICEAARKASHVILKTDYWIVALSREQANFGRSYVTLRKHKESLSELSAEEWSDFQAIVPRLEAAYEKALGGGRPFNWACMMNNAFLEPEPHPHVHWHLRPRYNGPTTLAGQTFTDPEFGNHYDYNRKQMVEDDLLDALAAKLLKSDLL